MKVMVTGVTGQLAQHFVKFILEKYPEYKVIATTSSVDLFFDKHIFDKSKVDIYISELLDTPKLIKQEQPDLFFNFAALTNVKESVSSPSLYLKINYQAVEAQLQAIYQHSRHTRYINAGSSEELAGQNPYADSKRQAQQIVKKYREIGIHAYQPILFNFTSTLQSQRFVLPKLIVGVKGIKKALQMGEPFDPIKVGNINIPKSYCWIDDVVNFVWAFSQDNASSLPYSMYIEDNYTVKQLIELVFSQAKIEGQWINDTGRETDYKFISKDNLEYVTIDPQFFREYELKSGQISNYLWKKNDKIKRIIEKLYE